MRIVLTINENNVKARKQIRQGRNFMIAGIVIAVFFAILALDLFAYVGVGLFIGGLVRWGYGKHKLDKKLEEQEKGW